MFYYVGVGTLGLLYGSHVCTLLVCLYVYSDIWVSMLDLVSSTVLCHMQLGECNTSCSIQPHISLTVLEWDV